MSDPKRQTFERCPDFLHRVRSSFCKNDLGSAQLQRSVAKSGEQAATLHKIDDAVGKLTRAVVERVEDQLGIGRRLIG